MSSSWIEYLKSVDSPALANAIEGLKLRPHHDRVRSDRFTHDGLKGMVVE